MFINDSRGLTGRPLERLVLSSGLPVLHENRTRRILRTPFLLCFPTFPKCFLSRKNYPGIVRQVAGNYHPSFFFGGFSWRHHADVLGNTMDFSYFPFDHGNAFKVFYSLGKLHARAGVASHPRRRPPPPPRPPLTPITAGGLFGM